MTNYRVQMKLLQAVSTKKRELWNMVLFICATQTETETFVKAKRQLLNLIYVIELK